MSKGLFAGLFWGTVLSFVFVFAVSLTSAVVPPVPETATSLTKEEPTPLAEPVEEVVATIEPVVEENTANAPVVENLAEETAQPEMPVVADATPVETETTPEAPVIESATGNPNGENLAGPRAAEPSGTELPDIAATDEATINRQANKSIPEPQSSSDDIALDTSGGTRPTTQIAQDTLEAPAETTKENLVVGQDQTVATLKSPETAEASEIAEEAPLVATLAPAKPDPVPETKPIEIKLPVIENPVRDDENLEVSQIIKDAPDAVDAASDTDIATLGTPTQGLVTAKTLSSRGTSNTRRLPTVGPSDLDVATPISTPSEAADGTALSAFSANFEDTGVPIFSIVLIDDVGAGISRDQLKNISFPITIAVDPARPDAKQAMAEYRAAGIEVVALLSALPITASPSDTEVTLAAYLDAMDEAVAVLDPPDARLQKNRGLLASVLTALRRSGHGVITYDQGLNAAQQAAARQGVPAATIFRVLDAENEGSPKIKRYLERAAFNANRDGSVVVLGRNRPETVAALLEWSLERKTSGLAIAPVSAVLRGK